MSSTVIQGKKVFKILEIVNQQGKFMSKTILDLSGKIDSLKLEAISFISDAARSRNVLFNFKLLIK